MNRAKHHMSHKYTWECWGLGKRPLKKSRSRLKCATSLSDSMHMHTHIYYTSSPSRSGDVVIHIFYINQPSLLTPFLFCSCICFCLYEPFHCISLPIDSPNNSLLSHSVLLVSSLPYWSFQLYILYQSLLQPWYNPLWLTGLKVPNNQLTIVWSVKTLNLPTRSMFWAKSCLLVLRVNALWLWIWDLASDSTSTPGG